MSEYYEMYHGFAEEDEEEEFEEESPLGKALTVAAKELVRGYIDQEKVSKMVKYEIDNVVREMVKNELGGVIKKEVSESVDEFVRKVIKETFDEMISGKLAISDGWSTREYQSFEDFTKEYIKDQLGSDYRVKDKMGKEIRDRVNKILDGIIRESSGVFAEYVIEKMMTKEEKK